MFEGLWTRYYALRQRVYRFERREIRDFRRWLEHTTNLIHLSVLLFVPLLIAIVTWLSGVADGLSFLLFPPLASGTHMLFSDPQGQYASPQKFVGGLTLGALCGWAALTFSALFIYNVPPNEFQVAPASAALGVLLTGVATWALDLEEPAAFSTALLVLVTSTTKLEYVITVALSSGIVAVVFIAWRELFYDHRAEHLYRSVKGNDQILVPMRGADTETTATFAAKLAAAHTAGKVVLLDTVEEAMLREADQNTDRDTESVERDGGPTPLVFERRVPDAVLDRLHEFEARIEAEIEVPCEIVVAVETNTPARTVLKTARETNCDLIVTAYEEGEDGLSPYVRQVFRGDIDAIVFRSVHGTTHWKRILVPVRVAGGIAHSMLDFARRLAGTEGWVSVCSCIAREGERRTAERTLADLVETVRCPCETHVARAAIEDYLSERAAEYDLIIMGASTDRSAASRLLSPPTFSRLRDIDCDVAVVHKG